MILASLSAVGGEAKADLIAPVLVPTSALMAVTGSVLQVHYLQSLFNGSTGMKLVRARHFGWRPWSFG